MAQKGKEALPRGIECGQRQSRSLTSVFQCDLKTRLRRENHKDREPEPIYDKPQGLAFYSKSKQCGNVSPSTASTLSRMYQSPVVQSTRALPRSKSTSSNLTVFTQDQEVQNSAQYSIMIRPTSQYLASSQVVQDPSLYDIPTKPHHSSKELSKPEQVYDTVHDAAVYDDKPVSITVGPATPPKPSANSRKSKQLGISDKPALRNTSERAKRSTKEKEKTSQALSEPQRSPVVSRRVVPDDAHIYDEAGGYEQAADSRIHGLKQPNSTTTLTPLRLSPRPGEVESSKNFKAHFIPKTKLTILQHITLGEFGSIFWGKLSHAASDDPLNVIVKSLKNNYEDEEEWTRFEREMSIITNKKHPNIVQIYGIVKEGNRIVMEYLPLKDLNTFLKNNARPVRTLIKYMLDVAMGMNFISERGLVHRDLAGRNVLNVGPPDEICKVTDIGFFRELPKDDYYYEYDEYADSPVRWLAPEVLAHNCFSSASDAWSYGILMREMFSPSMEGVPFTEEFDKATMATVMVPDTPKNCPDNIVQLMKSCWRMDPNERPTFLFLTESLQQISLCTK